MSELSGITFITPISIDSQERMNNLKFCVNYIVNRLKAVRHIVIEQDIFGNVRNVINTSGYEYLLHKENYGFFYKTKLMNIGLKLVKTRYVCIYDADVYIPAASFTACLAQLNKFKDVQMIIPHDGHFYDIPNIHSRNPNFTSDLLVPSELTKLHDNSPGGALLARIDAIRAIGGYNENIKSWGFEDDEIIARAAILGYPVVRPKNIACYHFHHYRGSNSSDINPHYLNNKAEFMKISKMNAAELKTYKLNY